MARYPYNTVHWRRVRPRILLRDGGRCQLRLPGCSSIATEVHHVVAPPVGHPFAVDNLRAVCKPCNIAERNARRARWARIHNGEESADGVETERAW